jgi:trk system potassium uptake protein TrkH
MMRAIILYRQVYREVLRAMHPRAIHPVRLGGAVVPDAVLHSVLAFSFIYMVVVVLLTLLMVASGLELVTSFSAIVATINNTGPGLGAVGPTGNFSVLTDFQTWVCAFSMILGRLELFTVLVVLTPAFWRK